MEPDKRLANTKVYVNGKSKEIQEIAFKLGYKWEYGGKEVIRTDEPFLYFFVNGFILGNRDMAGFIHHQFPELPADEILAMEPECEPKHKFKPFDKVLTRRSYLNKWNANFFSHYINDEHYPYACISDSLWSECIPFEGNEHLVGTNLNPKGE